MQINSKSLSLLRLLQLASSNLPVGGYTFSQGLEFAIDDGWLASVEAVEQWIEQSLYASLAYNDIPIISRQYTCIKENDFQQFIRWNQTILAMRETKELLLADLAMGKALVRLLNSMQMEIPEPVSQGSIKISMPSAFALAAYNQQLLIDDACLAYAWTVFEHQVMSATKLLPMGQTQAQKTLHKLSGVLVDAVSEGLTVSDEDIGMSLPGMAMASSKHEGQYSRLYRS